ncbi:MAG: hypothetical protein N3A55_09645 [Methylohalobius sp.]|nr:hypothetical protein [Methylohalobius sp.]
MRCLVFFLVLGLSACTATVDRANVQAQAGAPVSAQVEIKHIPYDPNLPKFVVVVEPLQVGAEGTAMGPPPPSPQGQQYYGFGAFGWVFPSGSPSPQGYTPPLQGMSEKVGKGLSAQLLSALSNAGNVVVIDYEHYQQHKDHPEKLLKKGEVGPFLIKGMVTEFNEVAEAGSQRKGGSLGWVGTTLGAVGALAGSREAAMAGIALAGMNPTFENTRARRTGSVALDLQVIDVKTGRMVGSFPARGSFTAETATSGFSLFGIGGGSADFAQSALGQATRAALNEALEQLTHLLASRGR